MSRKNEAAAGDEHRDPSSNVEAQVYAAMRELGWIVPQTDEDVRRAEARFAAHPIELPRQLTQPQEVLKRATAPISPKLADNPLQSTATQQNLARAAREGKEITSEVEARMHQDREAAEGELDNAS